jgi:hypothetical protein
MQRASCIDGELRPGPAGQEGASDDLVFSDQDGCAPDELLDQAFAESVARFQEDAGLEATGDVDEATLSALKERHGC